MSWPTPVRVRGEERRDDGERRHRGAADVVHRDAVEHRLLSVATLRLHQAALRLQEWIKAGQRCLRTVRAVAGDRQRDDARIDLAQALVGDPEPFAHAESIVVEHDVGLRDHLEEHFHRLAALQIENHPTLAAVVDTEAGAVRAKRIAARRLDLHDVGTETGQDRRRIGTRDHDAEVEHLHTRERGCVVHTSIRRRRRGAWREP